MPKSSSLFICQNCGYESPKWLGQCPDCGKWNTMEETLAAPVSKKSSGRTSSAGGRGLPALTVPFSQVKTYEHQLKRLPTGMEEFDRVLGGGIVFGSVVLIGGEPGIGKSTLLTHLVLNVLSKDTSGKPILYIAGEESPEQIGIRIDRMRSSSEKPNWKDKLLFVTSTDVDEIVQTVVQEEPLLVIVDSIQSLATEDLSGATGSIGQLKESTERITRAVKQLGIPTFLVGHVTKEGTIAGPKVLEHVVDAVLELSGERSGQYRLLRAVKNRFGATDEVGVFEVVEAGMVEVANPSAAFLQERQDHVPGSAIVAVMEGTRPVLVEIQVLAVNSQLPVPRRVARGISIPRVQLIAAVLEKYCGIHVGTQDIFVNVAGGFTITEPGADLAVAVAMASSVKNKPISSELVFVGEVGLLGEVRKVRLLAKRETEAKRLGFKNVISSETAKNLKDILKKLLV